MFNLARILDRNADRSPEGDAVIFRDTRLTHQDLYERVNALAAALRETGVGRGDIVGILLGNCPEYLETALAVNRLCSLSCAAQYGNACSRRHQSPHANDSPRDGRSGVSEAVAM